MVGRCGARAGVDRGRAGRRRARRGDVRARASPGLRGRSRRHGAAACLARHAPGSGGRAGRRERAPCATLRACQRTRSTSSGVRETRSEAFASRMTAWAFFDRPLTPMATTVLGTFDRLLASPFRFCAAMLVITTTGLGLDHFADRRGQLALAAATWGILLVACRPLRPEERAQVALVVMVASCAEVIGSVIWRVYEYRLGNLPLFVPP